MTITICCICGKITGYSGSALPFTPTAATFCTCGGVAQRIERLRQVNKRLREALKQCAQALQRNLAYFHYKDEMAMLEALDRAWEVAGREFCEQDLEDTE